MRTHNLLILKVFKLSRTQSNRIGTNQSKPDQSDQNKHFHNHPLDACKLLGVSGFIASVGVETLQPRTFHPALPRACSFLVYATKKISFCEA